MKKILKIALWTVLTLLISVLIFLVFSKFEKLFPVDGFLFAFEFHFLLMGWYAFSASYLNLNYIGSYYDSKSIEKNGLIYTYFGVNAFRRFLKSIGWNKISDKQNGGIIKDIDRLKRREKHTREAELAHAVLFVHFVIIIVYLLPKYNVFWLLLLNVIFHIYPVFIQRYNRPRYLKLISILERQKKNCE